MTCSCFPQSSSKPGVPSPCRATTGGSLNRSTGTPSPMSPQPSPVGSVGSVGSGVSRERGRKATNICTEYSDSVSKTEKFGCRGSVLPLKREGQGRRWGHTIEKGRARQTLGAYHRKMIFMRKKI